MHWHIEAIGSFYDPGEGAVVYFDPASGDTHLVSEFAAHLLRQLAAGPLSTEQLVAMISHEVDTSDRPGLAVSVTKVLQELAGLDILQHA